MKQVSFEKPDQLRDFLFTIIESMPNGILLADHEGLLLAVNQKAQHFMGQVGKSIPGRSCWQLMSQTLGVSPAEIAKLRQPGGRILCEVGSGRQKGETRCISIARNELKSPFLYISGFFLIFEDLTYPAMVQGQIERQERFAAMRDMAVRMSQDLKNPLGSLELYASILKRELKNDPDNERVTTRMIRAVRTMDYLLDNYVTFACLPEPRTTRIHVREWLEEAVDRLRSLDREKKVAFVREYRHEKEVIAGDAELLRQLVLNVGVNAMESMAGKGEVRIKTRTLPSDGVRPGYLEVTFVDQGSGIDRRNLKKIFDPFFTTKDRANGLGLAISHYITVVHQGFIKAANGLENGAVITVLLPCDCAAP